MTICAKLNDRDFLIGDLSEGNQNYNCIFKNRKFSNGDDIQDIKDYEKLSEILDFGIRNPPPIVIYCKRKGMRFRYLKSLSSYF